MTGKIQIINTQNHTGKILLNDGRESSIIKFPETFETGDIAEVKFRNNDPRDTVINMSIPGDEWHFGYLMNQFGNRGDLICTYPKMRGLIQYKHAYQISSIIQKNKHALVKFKIQKSTDGKVSAIDITEADKKDQFRCKTPKFGELEVKQERTKTGFVKEIVKTKLSEKEVISGVIKIVAKDRNNQLYGIIVRDDEEDDRAKNVYLPAIAFRKFYNRDPEKGNKVNFTTFTNQRGVQLKEFCEPSQKEYLPQNEQYGIISDNGKDLKFLLQDYEKFYKRTVEDGDIIYYHSDGGKLNFRSDDSEVVEKVIMKDPFYVGTIKNYDDVRGFGFITTNGIDYFFHISIYQKLFQTGVPNIGDQVTFTISSFRDRNTGDLKTQVSEFYHGFINCPKTTFKNFVEVEPNKLYYVYSSDNQSAAEVYKFDETLKSEAISCYKEKNVRPEFKLLAIEKLISINYGDKHINQEILRKEKENILSDLQKESLDKKGYITALNYENILQQMKYNPNQLSKFSEMPSECIVDISKPNVFTDRITDIDNKWLILTDEKVNLSDRKYDVSLFIDLESKIKELKILNTKEKWKVDLKQPKKVKPVFGLDEIFNI